MKKILIPVDGSVASEKAAKKAVEIGKLINAELNFITVVNTPSDAKYSYFGMNVEQAFIANCEEMLESLMKEESKMLDILVRNLDCGDLVTKKRVVVGRAYAEILRVADEEKFDLIVMGRRGLSNMERIFLGSVTQKVIAQASCPVMVVNE